MKQILIITSIALLAFISCEKKCDCDSVSYESTIQNNYTWTETNRATSTKCEDETMSSTYLDGNGDIVYVKTELECDN